MHRLWQVVQNINFAKSREKPHQKVQLQILSSTLYTYLRPRTLWILALYREKSNVGGWAYLPLSKRVFLKQISNHPRMALKCTEVQLKGFPSTILCCFLDQQLHFNTGFSLMAITLVTWSLIYIKNTITTEICIVFKWKPYTTWLKIGDWILYIKLDLLDTLMIQHYLLSPRCGFGMNELWGALSKIVCKIIKKCKQLKKKKAFTFIHQAFSFCNKL